MHKKIHAALSETYKPTDYTEGTTIELQLYANKKEIMTAGLTANTKYTHAHIYTAGRELHDAHIQTWTQTLPILTKKEQQSLYQIEVGQIQIDVPDDKTSRTLWRNLCHAMPKLNDYAYYDIIRILKTSHSLTSFLDMMSVYHNYMSKTPEPLNLYVERQHIQFTDMKKHIRLHFVYDPNNEKETVTIEINNFDYTIAHTLLSYINVNPNVKITYDYENVDESKTQTSKQVAYDIMHKTYPHATFRIGNNDNKHIENE